MSVCPKCQASVPEQAAFCQNCGAPLAPNPIGTGPIAGANPAQPGTAPPGANRKLLIGLLVALIILLTAGGVAAYMLVDPARIDYGTVVPGVEIKEVQPLNFKNPYLKDVAVTGKIPGDAGGRYLGLLSFNLSKAAWEVVYEEKAKYAAPKVTVARLLPGRLDQVIVSTVEGSGGYLSYRVLGWQGDEPKVLLKRGGIFQGSFAVQGGQLIEKSGHQGLVYQWNGTTFIPTAMAMENQAPAGAGDVQVEFSIDANENVRLSTAEVVLQKGRKLLLVRTNTGVSERILCGPPTVLSGGKDGYTAVGTGTAEIKIIPGGYDWEYVRTIKVTVTD